MGRGKERVKKEGPVVVQAGFDGLALETVVAGDPNASEKEKLRAGLDQLEKEGKLRSPKKAKTVPDGSEWWNK